MFRLPETVNTFDTVSDEFVQSGACVVMDVAVRFAMGAAFDLKK
jgi:hypothetical protein